ncbi:hypothetical protein [uncultured Tenacibaculum sp.]|uniref:hypothetical protein n=1 Tax=uncultured Tenacibaculum sp. TaxID=174713 RepID=UPI00260A8FA3|nr:hypothetical protein [uncultured Tenacibaculum sp.]
MKVKIKIAILAAIGFISTSFAQGHQFNVTKNSPNFPNGVANQVSYIDFGDIQFWGYMEITLTSGYSYQNSVGKYTKIYEIGKNPGNLLYRSSSETKTVFGLLSNQWKLGEAFLDTNNHLKIPIYHLVSTSNTLTININGLSKTTFDKNLITITSPTVVSNNETRDYVTYKSQVNIMDKVGIGTLITGPHKLAVEGSIGAREIKVLAAPNWADFVFESNYNLPTLFEVENHIKEKGHLKDIPSAKDVKNNGFFLAEMDAKLLQKIEELTLYTITQEKQLKIQKEKIKTLEAQTKEIKELKELVKKLLENK